jgi:hypothetical protein
MAIAGSRDAGFLTPLSELGAFQKAAQELQWARFCRNTPGLPRIESTGSLPVIWPRESIRGRSGPPLITSFELILQLQQGIPAHA